MAQHTTHNTQPRQERKAQEMMRSILLACVVLMAVADKGTNTHLWSDTETTTQLWRLCSSGSVQELAAMIEDQPDVVHIRASDGRGPLWWAIENKQDGITKLLLEHGANPEERDVDGKKAEELTDGPSLTQWAKELLAQKTRELEEMDGAADEEDYGYDD